MKHIFFLVISVLLIMSSACAQELKLSEKLPEFSATARIGDSSFTINNASLKGKAVLIDFWGVSCIDCIGAMPKMLSFQQQFGDQLTIVQVTPDSRAQVDALFQKLSRNKKSAVNAAAGRALPLITDDRQLKEWAWLTGYPTHAWFNAKHEFLGFAYGSQISVEAIGQLVRGEVPKIQFKKRADFESDQPLTWAVSKNLDDPTLTSYSVFTSAIENGNRNAAYTMLKDSFGDVVGMAILNEVAWRLYNVAYLDWIQSIWPKSNFVPYERIVYKTDRQYIFRGDKASNAVGGEQMPRYSYGIRRPSGTSLKDMRMQMRAELDQHLQFKTSVQRLKVPCLVITRTPILPHSKPGVPDSSDLVLTHMKVLGLTNRLQSALGLQRHPLPLITELDLNEIISIRIPWAEVKDEIPWEKVFAALRAQGFSIEPAEREMEMLVIEDRP